MELIKMDLYSKDKFIFESTECLLTGRKIFTGNQPDDFSLINFDVDLKKSGKILLLGLGYGAALRPILTSNKVEKIIAVDINSETVEVCSSIFKKYFPNLKDKIEFKVEDAVLFVEKTSEFSFDSICVDLFNSTHYPDFLMTTTFWTKLKRLLKLNGAVLTNTWGLPLHLNPNKGRTAQNEVFRRLCENFNHSIIFPNRRNITVLSSDKVKTFTIPPYSKDYNINKLDLNILKLQRLRYISSLSLVYTDISMTNMDINQDMNKEMNLRWNDIEKIVVNALGDNKSLIEILHNENESTQIIKHFLMNDQFNEATFIPNAIGSLSYNSIKGFEWYLDWVLNDWIDLLELSEKWLINIGLWQVACILANPYSQTESWEDKFSNVIDTLTNKVGEQGASLC